MPQDILVVKKKKGQLEVKVKSNVKSKDYKDPDYLNVIDFKDYKQIAILLNDLKLIFNSPIDKAIAEYQKDERDWW